jgi:hypothetical protein
MNQKLSLLLNKTVSEVGESCPRATTDIKDNIKNRNWTIKNFGYGPLNPDVPDSGFWDKKAEMWNSDIETVMTARCCNCAAFDQSDKIIDCIIPS